MCAILDANLLGELFKRDADPAASQFLNWMLTGRCRLAVGGKLRQELERSEAFREWAVDAALDGRLQSINDDAVELLTKQLIQSNACQSDDEHIVALASISGARLLYSNDNDLQDDFRNNSLLQPRGRLLPLGGTRKARRSRESLLNQPDLCPQHRR